MIQCVGRLISQYSEKSFFMPSKKIAILTEAFSNGNGVARILLNLMKGFVDRGYSVDLLYFSTGGPFEQFIPEGVRIIDLGNHVRIRTSIKKTMQYLRQEKPAVLYCANSDSGFEGVVAKLLAMSRTPVMISIPSVETMERPAYMTDKDKLYLKLKRIACPLASKVIPVSHGVAGDTMKHLGIPKQKIQVIYNPVVTETLKENMQKPAEHKWLQNKTLPVVLAVGRLDAVKSYDVLIRAFKNVISQVEARLIILGEGDQRDMLASLVQELDLTDFVDMPGFTGNPYAYMKNADLLALSSKNEGLPTVIIEAMACGCPVVSTDCPVGPSEILQNGEYGTLVPVGDSEALGQAMIEALQQDHDIRKLQQRAEYFSEDKIIDEYLELFQLK